MQSLRNKDEIIHRCEALQTGRMTDQQARQICLIKFDVRFDHKKNTLTSEISSDFILFHKSKKERKYSKQKIISGQREKLVIEQMFSDHKKQSNKCPIKLPFLIFTFLPFVAWPTDRRTKYLNAHM